MKDNKRTTKQVIAEQQAINRKLWSKENGRLHHVDANKLIAEFMGLHPLSRASFISDKNQEYYESLSELKYHTSWDWLMPVIENIDHLQHEPVVSIENALATRSIDDTYKSVVEFIKQYNNED